MQSLAALAHLLPDMSMGETGGKAPVGRFSVERPKARTCEGPDLGSDEVLMQYNGSGTSNREWLIADVRGSIVAITDNTGTVTQINKYNASEVVEWNSNF